MANIIGESKRGEAPLSFLPPLFEKERGPKGVRLTSHNTKVLLPHGRVLTLGLDKQAQEKGYKLGYSEALANIVD